MLHLLEVVVEFVTECLIALLTSIFEPVYGFLYICWIKKRAGKGIVLQLVL